MKQPANLFAEQATQLFRLCQCEMNKDKSTWERGGRKRQAIHEMKLSQKPAGASKHYLFTIYLSLGMTTYNYLQSTYFYLCRITLLLCMSGCLSLQWHCWL